MNNIKTEIIDTTEKIRALVDCLAPAPFLGTSTMYIDLEGIDLCREGSLSILTLLIDTGNPTEKRVCLIDVHTLGARAFTTAGDKQKTLKDILQDGRITKVFFDVRNDSDALFAHFGVALQGVEDVQLMESATRKTTASRERLNGLTKCVENNMFTSTGGNSLDSWKEIKKKGERLFKAEHGGSYEVFNQRPIPSDIISYCVGDVQYLPLLRTRFWTRQTTQWQDLVDEETKKRVATSQRLEYQPHGADRVLAPWSNEQNITLDRFHDLSSISDFEDFGDFEDFEDILDSDDDYEGPMSCRDIIDDCDYELYYSD